MPEVLEWQVGAAVLIAAVAALGLMVGSFLSVVIHRLPRLLQDEWAGEAGHGQETRAEGLIGARSRCPSCGRVLRLWHLVPIASYLALRGRCAWCRWRIPIRYPAIELLSAVLSALVAWRFGFGEAMGGALLVTWALIALSAIDIDTQLIPDVITMPVLWLGLIFNLWAIFTPLSSAVLGAIGGYLALWAVYQAFRLLTGKEGMGRGDFKLLAMLGAWLGWQAVPLILVLSTAMGAVVGSGLVVFGRHRRDTPLPFGPFLAAAGWLSLMWGEDMVGAYLRWAG